MAEAQRLMKEAAQLEGLKPESAVKEKKTTRKTKVNA
jgi:hypothetical protein